MENPETPPTENAANKPLAVRKPGHSKLSIVIVLLILVSGILSGFSVYHKEHTDAAGVVLQNSRLNTQITTLTNEIRQQNNINSGAVSEGSGYKDPTGKVGLLNGAITMTLPKGWVRVPESGCTGGTIDSTIVCQDTAAVAPSNLVSSDGTAKWSAAIGVFNYSSADGDSKNWYYTKYEGKPAGSDLTAINPVTLTINSYNAYSEERQAFHVGYSDPEYVFADYAVVHGQYGVVVNTQVEAGTIDGPGAFDYRATYQPLINQMVQSIKFQD
jgi:hypothetical protein